MKIFTSHIMNLFRDRSKQAFIQRNLDHFAAQVSPADFPRGLLVWVVLNKQTPLEVSHQGVSPSGRHRVKVVSTSQLLVVDQVYFSNPFLVP